MGEHNSIKSLLMAIEKGNPFSMNVRDIKPCKGFAVITMTRPYRQVKVSENVFNKIRDYITIGGNVN